MYEISWKEQTAIVMSAVALGGGGGALGYSLGSHEANNHRKTAEQAQQCAKLIGAQAVAASALPSICQDAVRNYTEPIDPYGYAMNEAGPSLRFSTSDMHEIATQNRQNAKTSPREMADVGFLAGMVSWLGVLASLADRRRLRHLEAQ
jgi:hypothetical protein